MAVSKSITVVLIIFMLAPLHAENAKPPCDEFKRLIDLPRGKGIDRYFLTMSSIKGSEEEYFNLDVDGDDVSDVIKGGCSSSLTPANPCSISIEMSSGKKFDFAFKDNERFYLARYHEQIYAIVSPTAIIADENTGTEKAVPFDQIKGLRTVFSLGRQGINLLCTRL